MVLFWGAALWFGTPYLYSDGDTATWIWMLRHGEPVYGSPMTAGPLSTAVPAWDVGPGLPMRLTNYPPLYLHAVAWLAPSDASILRTGAALSIVGFVLAIAGVALSAYRASGQRVPAILAALLLGGAGSAAYNAPSCFPDTAGLGLAVAGVTLAALRLRGWPLWSGLLFCAAVLVKHSLIVLPAGTCLWALANASTRRAGCCLVVSLSTPLFGVLWACDLFAPLVLWTKTTWAVDYFALQLAVWGLPLLPGIVVAGALLSRWQQLSPSGRQVLGPWAFVAGLGVVWLIALGRRGSGANYTIELITALAVLLPIASERRVLPRVAWLHGIAILCLSWGLTTYHLGWLWPKQARDQAVVQSVLRDRPGALLAETPWYTTRLGRPPVVISYLATQLAHAGRWQSEGLLAKLRDGQIAAVILNFPVETSPKLGHADRLPPAVLPLLRDRYELAAKTDSVFVYTPRRPASSASTP